MRSLAITSGKGGVGKTTTAVNVCLALGQRGRRVLLVDADLALANVDIVAGVAVKHTLADVLDGSRPLSEAVTQLAPNVWLLAAGSGVLRLERLRASEREAMAAELREVARGFDLTVFDTGAGMTENVLFFDTLASEVLFVTTPEPTALTDTYALIKVLHARQPDKQVAVFVNKVRSVREATEVYEHLARVCREFLKASIGFAGCMTRDQVVEQAVRDRTPFVVSGRSDSASHAMAGLARRLC